MKTKTERPNVQDCFGDYKFDFTEAYVYTVTIGAWCALFAEIATKSRANVLLLKTSIPSLVHDIVEIINAQLT